MKPITLEVSAFGPYGDRAEVDFGPLADVGLFVVSGPTGAGKSTIFDAICFALYGSLSGARAGHADVRSHYADPAARSSVTLVFDAGSERWRVTRQPSQTVQKVRGSGTTNQPATAVLERWDGANWQPDSTKVRDVTARCRELIGLSLEQFERVVLLPQGRFAEVLNAKTSERSELLRTLFGSEIFDRAADILAEQARESERSLLGVDQQRDVFLQRAIESIDQIELTIDELPSDIVEHLGSAAEDVDSPHASQLSLLDADPDRHHDGLPGPAETPGPGERLDALVDGPLRRLTSLVERRRSDADAARAVRERAETQQRMIEQRSASLHSLSILDARTQEMAEIEARLTAARSVADLEQAIARRSALRASQDTIADAMAELWSSCVERAPGVLDGADHLLEHADEPTRAIVTDLVGRLAARSSTLDALTEQMQRLDQLQREQRTTAARLAHFDQLDLRDEGARAAATRESKDLATEAEALRPTADARDALVSEIEEVDRLLSLRAEADRAAAALAAQQQRRVTVAADVARTTAAIAAADAEIAALSEVIDELPARRERRTAGEQRCSRKRELDRAAVELARATDAADQAKRASEQMFQDFVAQTAPRLAADLTPGDPCPVCGAEEHPSLAAHVLDTDSPSVDAAMVAAASAAASAADVELSRWRTTIAGLIEADPALDSIDWDTLDAERAAAIEALGVAEQAVLDRDTLHATCAAVRTQLSEAEQQLSAIDLEIEKLRLDDRELSGALGPARARTASELTSERSDLAQRHRAADEAIQRSGWIESRRAELATEQHEIERTSRQRAIDRATAQERQEQLATTEADIRAQLTLELGGADLADLRDQLTRLRESLEHWQKLSVDLAGAEASRRDAEQICAAIVDRSGFESEADAMAAILAPTAVEQLAAQHGRWANESATHRATLAALQIHDLPDHAPDLDHLVAKAIEAAAQHRIVDEAATLIDRLVHQARTDLAEMASLDAESAAQRLEHENLQRVASVVRGQNSRRLSLENWVLSVYLHDVVQHANLHLATMSNGRYRLAVQDAPSNQVGQHGLDLVVDDAHTGRIRPSVSLSGGETFQASLALALGLADVVMVGRAGLRLDALFVDEGFGSLDADAIDQAITVLDGLRSRGSMVGVITHVEALKAALPVAIDVQPRSDLRGSIIRQVA